MRSGATLKTALQGVAPRPSVLIEIATGLTSAGDEYIRITSDPVDRSFSGSTYTARPFEHGGFKVEQRAAGNMTITASDTDAYWGTWLLSTDFRWQKVNRYLIDRSEGVTAYQDTFRVRNIERTDRSIRFMCEPLSAILRRVQVPQQRLTREEFPGIPAEGEVA
jgi:hypothetical protein